MRSGILVIGVVVWLSACTTMAPGIQFGKAQPSSTETDEADGIVAPAKILAITPRLVRQEKVLRDQQVAEDISALLQPAQVYRIEAGDVLHIVVWDHPELSASMLPAGVPGAVGVAGVAVSPMQPQSGFEIDQQGMLDFPYAGKLKLAGLTTVEAHQQVVRSLSRYLKNPKVTMRVLTYRSKRVYIDGEVKQPGVQAINDLPMTLTEAWTRFTAWREQQIDEVVDYCLGVAD